MSTLNLRSNKLVAVTLSDNCSGVQVRQHENTKGSTSSIVQNKYSQFCGNVPI